MVKFSWVGGSATDAGSALTVPRPLLGPWDFDNDKVFLLLAIVVLAIADACRDLVRAEHDRPHAARAVRGSEVAAQSIGISTGAARVVAFAVSAFVAAIGGAMIAIHQENVGYDTNFSPFGALFWLVLVVTFGARLPSGALWAAGTFSLFNKIVLQGTFIGWILRDPERIPGIFPISPKWRFILFGSGTIQYAKHPEGMLEMTRTRAAGASGQARRTAPRQSSPGSGPPPAPPPRSDVEEVAS